MYVITRGVSVNRSAIHLESTRFAFFDKTSEQTSRLIGNQKSSQIQKTTFSVYTALA
jgi:hypothetical protein